jgi:hypothetical protein
MDNEASTALKNYLAREGIYLHLILPPHINRLNDAERAIQTFKNHFIAGICSIFPLKFQDKLLPQTAITLNILRTSRINPPCSISEGGSYNIPAAGPTAQHFFPLTPHPSAPDAPYVPQCTAGENFFSTFEEEHVVATLQPRYNTRASSRQQHYAHHVQHKTPCILCPITFNTTSLCPPAPQHVSYSTPVVNAVINQDVGVSLEYFQLIQYETMFPSWNKSALNEYGCLVQ